MTYQPLPFGTPRRSSPPRSNVERGPLSRAGLPVVRGEQRVAGIGASAHSHPSGDSQLLDWVLVRSGRRPPRPEVVVAPVRRDSFYPIEGGAPFDSRYFDEKYQRVAGIEPAWPAWEAGALPLCYTRASLARRILSLVPQEGKPQVSPLGALPPLSCEGGIAILPFLGGVPSENRVCLR